MSKVLILKITFVDGNKATCERLFSSAKHIEIFLRNTRTGNRLNYCIMRHVYFDKTDQPKMVEMPKDFIGDNEVR